MKTTIKDFCKKHNLTIDQFYGKEKIGGDLYLGSLTSIPEGFNPTVGGDLVWKNGRKHIGATVIMPTIPKPDLKWKDGKYTKIDGIFCEIVSAHAWVISGLDVEILRAKKINKSDSFFIAKAGGFSSHGETMEKAVEDQKFKIAAEKIRKEPIYKDTIITTQHYRIITGACEFGVKEWMQNNNITKQEITAGELMPLLKKTNAYGFDRFKSLVKF